MVHAKTGDSIGQCLFGKAFSQVIELETSNRNILEFVKLQKQSGKRLLNTIKSILNLSRIDAEKDQLRLRVVEI
jgi:signal transduction histidine kinase